ncbi:MAG: DUF2723 domain-containing protein [Polyangiaceae bacterium]
MRTPLPFRDAAIVAVAMLVLYAASAPRTVTLEDSGIFIMSADVAGVSHPPGYPIHSVLGKLFTLLPLGSVAYRVHLLSALFAALSCGALLVVARLLTMSAITAYVVALSYGVSREFWSQAIIAEVYSLSTFFFFTAMALALRYVETTERRTLRLAALVTGLGLAHHWPLFLLSFPGVLVMTRPRWREMTRTVGDIAVFLLLGLTPYLYLLVRSNLDPAISFYGPLDSLEKFFFFVSRSGYADVDASATAGMRDRLLFTAFLGRELVAQFSILGAWLAGVGFALQWRKMPRHVAWGLSASFAGGTLVLLLLLRRDFGYLERAVFQVYPLIPYGVMALWLGLALDEVGERLAVRGAAMRRIGAGALGGAVIIAALAMHLRTNWRASYTWARDYAETILGAVAPNAIVITTADSDIGPIGYLQRVEHVRPDVDVFNDKGLVFSNRLFQPPASDRARVAAFRRLIDETDRPVYVIGEFALGYPTEDFGLFKKILRRGEPSVTLDPRVLSRCRAIEEGPVPDDMWTIDHRNVLLVDCGRLLGPIVHLSPEPEPRRFRDELSAISRHLYGKIGVLEGLAERGDPDALLRWVEEAEQLIEEESSKQARGRLLFIRGFVENRKGATLRAVDSFRRSIDVFPDPKNGAVLGLLSLYAAQRRRTEYQELRTTMYTGRAVPPPVQELDRTFGK